LRKIINLSSLYILYINDNNFQEPFPVLENTRIANLQAANNNFWGTITFNYYLVSLNITGNSLMRGYSSCTPDYNILTKIGDWMCAAILEGYTTMIFADPEYCDYENCFIYWI